MAAHAVRMSQSAEFDPQALYSAVQSLRNGNPAQAIEHADIISELVRTYFNEIAPGSQNLHGSQLSKLRDEIKLWTRRRTVETIVMWLNDRTQYTELPGKLILRWFTQDDIPGSSNGKTAFAFELAETVLADTSFKAGETTLKDAYYPRDRKVASPPNEDFRKFFSLPDPREVFYDPDVQMPKRVQRVFAIKEMEDTLAALPKHTSPKYRRELKRKRLAEIQARYGGPKSTL